MMIYRQEPYGRVYVPLVDRVGPGVLYATVTPSRLVALVEE